MDESSLLPALALVFRTHSDDPRLSIIVDLVRYHYRSRDVRPGYGAGWPKARREAIERDGYVCVTCGATEALEVHHKRPVRTFKDRSQAHSLTNLVTLCRPCHSEAEKAVRAEERSQ